MRTGREGGGGVRVDGVTRIGGGSCIREGDGGCGVGDGRDGGYDGYDGGDAVGGRGCSRGGSTGGGGDMGGTSYGWDTKDARRGLSRLSTRAH